MPAAELASFPAAPLTTAQPMSHQCMHDHLEAAPSQQRAMRSTGRGCRRCMCSRTSFADRRLPGLPACPQKVDPKGMPTQSAHPARFSPDDKFSRERILLKKRFGLLPTQQPAKEL